MTGRTLHGSERQRQRRPPDQATAQALTMATTTTFRWRAPRGTILILATALAACGGDPPPAPPPVDLSMLPALCDRLAAGRSLGVGARRVTAGAHAGE
jgi:hypothetical protein